MELAVLSDIHGNYEAFCRCIEYALARNIDTLIFLGDYLGEFPYPQKTMEIIYSLNEKYNCFFIRGNKEDYWLSRRYDDDCVWKDGNATVHNGGKAQFMILRQHMHEWEHEFISLDYDKDEVIKAMHESGLYEIAPYWSKVTSHLILTGEVSHGTVLSRAMELCVEENGQCDWYDVPEKYWDKAVEELLG